MLNIKKRIAIQVAMKQEGLGLAEKLGLKEISSLDSDLGFREFEGKFGNNLEVRLFLHGTDTRYQAEQVGLEAAAVCTALILRQYKVDILLNFGTAGAFSKSNFKIGEVSLVRSPVRFHDRRVPLPGYFESQEGNHRVANIEELQNFLKIKTALVSSGSSLEMSSRDHEVLNQHDADLKEMECAAISWVAEKKRIPFVAIKSVTDFIDIPEKVETQFLKNLEYASSEVQKTVFQALQFLDENTNDAIWKWS